MQKLASFIGAIALSSLLFSVTIDLTGKLLLKQATDGRGLLRPFVWKLEEFHAKLAKERRSAKIQWLPEGPFTIQYNLQNHSSEFESATRRFTPPLRVLRSFASFASFA